MSIYNDRLGAILRPLTDFSVGLRYRGWWSVKMMVSSIVITELTGSEPHEYGIFTAFIFDTVVAPSYRNTDLSFNTGMKNLQIRQCRSLSSCGLRFKEVRRQKKSRRPFERKRPKDYQKVLWEFPVSEPSFCGVSMRKNSTMSSTQRQRQKKISHHRPLVGFTHTDPSVSLRSLAHLASSLLIGSPGISVDGMAPGWLFNSDQLTLVN